MYAIRLILAGLLSCLPCLAASQANYPAYSATANTIQYGPTAAAPGAISYNNAGSVAGGCLGVQLDPLYLSPGTYTVTSWKFGTGRTGTADCDAAWVVVYSVSDSTYTLVWSYDGFASLDAVDTSAYYEQEFTPNTTLTIAPSTTYVAGIVLRHKAAGSSSRPLWFCMNDAEVPLSGIYWRNDADLGTTLPTTITNGGTTVATATNEPLLIQKITLTTANRKLCEIGPGAYTGTDATFYLPTMTTKDYWIFLTGVEVANGEALTILFQDHTDGANSTLQTLVLDMGATDKVTFGGSDVSLNQRWTGTCIDTDLTEGVTTLDVTPTSGTAYAWWDGVGEGERARYIQIAGVDTFAISEYVDADTIKVTGDATAANNSAYSISEEGDQFSIGINVRPVANTIDVFWCNITTGQGAVSTSGTGTLRDIITRGHACSAGAARHAAAYANTVEPTHITLSGTATVPYVRVGYQPLVLFGDSQLGTKNTDLAAAADTRLGAVLDTAFTYDRFTWIAAVSGARITTDSTYSEALWETFMHDTPGKGDLCEMSGILLAFEVGVNDVSSGIGNPGTDEERNQTVAGLSYYSSTVLNELYSRAAAGGTGDGRHAIVLGLPQWPEGNANEEATIVRWNYTLRGLALGCRASFFDPYSLGPGITDGLHYTTAGAATVSAKIAATYESGRTQTGMVGGQNWIEW